MKARRIFPILFIAIFCSCDHIDRSKGIATSAIHPNNFLLPLPAEKYATVPDRTYSMTDSACSIPVCSSSTHTSAYLHKSLVRDFDQATSNPLRHTIHSANSDPDPKQEAELELKKGRNWLLAGIIFVPGFYIAIIHLRSAKEIVTRNNIDDQQLKERIQFNLTLAILLATILTLAEIVAAALLFVLTVQISRDIGACYIATMVYGSYDAPEVLVLRKFRDEKLKPYFLGRTFIMFYYSTSPLFVAVFHNNRAVNQFCKRILDKFICHLMKRNTWAISVG